MLNEGTTGYRDLTRTHHLWGAVFRDGTEIYRGTSFSDLCNNLPTHPTTDSEAEHYQVFRHMVNFGSPRFEILTGVAQQSIHLLRYDTLEQVH